MGTPLVETVLKIWKVPVFQNAFQGVPQNSAASTRRRPTNEKSQSAKIKRRTFNSL
jgi:hypothetical protein